MAERISPKYRKWLVWGLGMGAVMLAVALTGPKEDRDSRRTEKEVRHVLTDFDTRKVGVDSLAANIRLLHAENNNLTREIGSLKHQLELIRKNSGLLGAESSVKGNGDSAANEEIRNLREELKLIKSLLPKEIQHMRKRTVTSDGDVSSPDSAAKGQKSRGTGTDGYSPGYNPEASAVKPESVTAGSGKRRINSAGDNGGMRYGSDRRRDRIPGSGARHIRSLADEGFARVSDKKEETGATTAGNGGRGYYIPAGSVMSGILLTGLDAPTRENARNDPFPVLINIDRNAILPNGRNFDFRECFVIAAGFGDMSSERVYLRTESLNCVAESGRVLEVPLNGYAAGEDGKAGIRGRLVSKQGVLIARSLTAGFLEGLAGAFDVSPVPVINTSGSSGSMEYQSVYNSRALQGAAVSGSSKALERIASFYLKLAEEMFPVLEVDAARRVDLILTKGVSFDYSLDD